MNFKRAIDILVICFFVRSAYLLTLYTYWLDIPSMLNYGAFTVLHLWIMCNYNAVFEELVDKWSTKGE